MKFYIGQKVVCIDGDWVNLDGTKNYIANPVEGKIYTVSRYHAIKRGFLYLVEFDQWVFEEDGFAPIQENTDTLSIANQLVEELKKLDKSPIPQRELV